MLISLKNIFGFGVRISTEDIGKFVDCYYNEQTMRVDYIVVKSSASWIGPNRLILISPNKLSPPNMDTKVIPVNISFDELKTAPGVITDFPEILEDNLDIARYQVLAPKWDARGIHVIPAPPRQAKTQTIPTLHSTVTEGKSNTMETSSGTITFGTERTMSTPAQMYPILRSVKQFTGFKVEAMDGRIGNVEDLIVDTDNDNIRYIVVETGTWLTGHKRTLISPDWVKNCDWDMKEAKVDLTKQQIQSTPIYEPKKKDIVTREYEHNLFKHYKRPPYWEQSSRM